VSEAPASNQPAAPAAEGTDRAASKRPKTLSRLWTILFLLLGFGLMAGVFVYQDMGEVAQAIASVGWGLVALTAFHLVPLAVDTIGIHNIVPPGYRVGFLRLVGILWVGESINQLLPVGQIGGEFIKTRLLILCKLPPVQAGATIVVNLTLGVFTQGLFAIVGIVILVLNYDEGGDATTYAAAGAGVILGGVALFYLAQRIGLFRLISRFVNLVASGKDWLSVVGGAHAIDNSVAEIWRNRRAVLRSIWWQFLAWVLGTGEVLLAMHFMGREIGILEATMMESLGQAVRSAAFLVPASLGVQEGGYVLLATAIGLSPETGLVLSLVKRVRELALGVPGLLAWQFVEGRRWLLLRR
jgi:putative membrane protein